MTTLKLDNIYKDVPMQSIIPLKILILTFMIKNLLSLSVLQDAESQPLFA